MIDSPASNGTSASTPGRRAERGDRYRRRCDSRSGTETSVNRQTMKPEDEWTVTGDEFDIRVAKSLLTDGVDAPTVRVAVASESSDPLAVRVVERWPRDREAIRPDERQFDDRRWRSVGPGVMEYRDVVQPQESLEAEYRLDCPPEDARDAFGGPTRLIVRPASGGSPEVVSVDVGRPPETGADSTGNARAAAAGHRGVRHDSERLDGRGSTPDADGCDRADDATSERWAPNEDRAGSPDGEPALGLVVSSGHTDAIARTVLRAFARGYRVYVSHAEACDPEAVQLAASLGATVVDTDASSPDAFRQGLTMVARSHGHSGLILQTAPYETIDYARSREALVTGDGDVVDAVLRADSSGESTVVVGIPAYNEAETIAEVVETALGYVDEVVVVDDGSTDDTATRAERAGATVVSHARNRGYGGALKTIFEQTARRKATNLAIVDADGQHDPSDVPRLVDEQRSTGAEIVIGSRFVPGAETNMPRYRRFGIGVVNVLMNLSVGNVFGSYIRDTQSGFRVYNRRAVESLAAEPAIGEGMQASTDIIFHAHAQGFAIEEVPTAVDYDVDNANSQNPVTHGLQLVKNIFVDLERRRPVTTLGIPGFVSLLVGLAFAYWSFQNYLATDAFPLGVGLASVLFTTLGVFAYFTAIVLHAVNSSPGHR